MSAAGDRPPIEVPHYARSGNPILDAEFIIAEAAILDLDNGMGRIRYFPAAKHAVLSLVAAGWTPPGADGGDDEASRLRRQIAIMQAYVDENNAHMDRMHDREQAAELARQRMSSAAIQQAHKLQNAVIETVRGRKEPEPTMTYTEVAKGLLKFADIGRDTERRELDKAAKARAKPVETVAVTLPGLGDD